MVKQVIVLVRRPVDHIEVTAQEPGAGAGQPKLVQLSEEIQLCCIHGGAIH
jgi:hypothetical protein